MGIKLQDPKIDTKTGNPRELDVMYNIPEPCFYDFGVCYSGYY